MKIRFQGAHGSRAALARGTATGAGAGSSAWLKKSAKSNCDINHSLNSRPAGRRPDLHHARPRPALTRAIKNGHCLTCIAGTRARFPLRRAFTNACACDTICGSNCMVYLSMLVLRCRMRLFAGYTSGVDRAGSGLLFSFLTQVKGLLNARHDLRVVKAAIIPQPEVTCAGTGVNVGHLSAVKLGQHERFTLPVFTA